MDIQKQIEEIEKNDHEFYVSVGSYQPIKESVLKNYLDGILSENVRVESWGVHTKDEYIGIIDDQQSIISQQSSEIERQREAIERVIAELEENAKSRMIQETKTFNAGGTGYVLDREARRAYEVAVRLLKEVLADAHRNTGNPSKP